jgi:MFS family permease
VSASATPFVRQPATWYCYFLAGTQIYLANVQGNVIPFLQDEFALSYRVVSLHSSAVALGYIIIGLGGRRVINAIGRRYSLWLGACGLGLAALCLCISPGPWASIPSCLCIGLFGSLMSSVMPAVISDMHGEGRRQAFAEQGIVTYSFAIVGPLATGFFVAHGMGWRPAVLVGTALGLGLTAIFRNVRLPPDAPPAKAMQAKLPAAFWAYWCLIAFTCALEFSILLWSPTFLERVIGFPAAAAATAAAGFFAGVLAGRIVLRALVQRYPPVRILSAAFIIGVVGFVFYWWVDQPWAAVVGIVMLGLCIGPQYPLNLALAMGVAAGGRDAAATRVTLAVGLAMLLAPELLGALADQVGLRLAHLTLPALIAAAVVSFAVASQLARRLNPTAPAPYRSPA